MEELRREILTGHLPAGSRLPPEGELAHRFGTNRNTLREAVRTLEGLNLIQVRQGDGVTVRDFRATGELSLLPHYLAEAANPAEQLAALQEVLRLRRLVLVEVVSRAATGSTPDEVLGLQQQLELIRRSLPHTRELIAADLEFYRRLVAASHSLIYIWIFNTFVRVYTAVIDALEQLWVLPAGYLEHLDALTAAIAAHDSTRARQIMDTHLSSSDVLALELARHDEASETDA